MLAPKRRPNPPRDAERELEAVNRKIKAVVAMLADPAFDGLDELRPRLAELKARRDTLQARLKPADVPTEPALSEQELRAWAMEQFTQLDQLASRTAVDLNGRQLVAAFVERIEIDAETKTGAIFIAADLEQDFRQVSTRVPIGE